MKNLKELVLRGTAIKELPSSIEHLEGLSALCLEGCKNLAYLPESFCNLKALRKLFLCGCSKLEKLPMNLRNLEFLEHLWATGCKGQESVGFPLPPLSGLSHLKCLLLRDCNVSKLPADLNCLSSISDLYLNDNNFEIMPACIKQLSLLRSLDISGCKRLRSLPMLPPRLEFIDAHDCRSLETISGLEQLRDFEYLKSHCRENFIYTNCFRLDQNARSNIVADAQLRIQRLATRVKDYNRKVSLSLPFFFYFFHLFGLSIYSLMLTTGFIPVVTPTVTTVGRFRFKPVSNLRWVD